ncbi:hypothetical protein CC86DRAFT_6149 [Ophiobolus disseminans]|uniref:Uncharacterized protein n=1 Tax=Ophiobolus disseminans TaxID=1469910 RepID=A0A6A7AIZ9_9PLEO|nr:hypothetical protein CC86DRAFT_6149 [Ophiobolus disseminans]
MTDVVDPIRKHVGTSGERRLALYAHVPITHVDHSTFTSLIHHMDTSRTNGASRSHIKLTIQTSGQFSVDQAMQCEPISSKCETRDITFRATRPIRSFALNIATRRQNAQHEIIRRKPFRKKKKVPSVPIYPRKLTPSVVFSFSSLRRRNM